MVLFLILLIQYRRLYWRSLSISTSNNKACQQHNELTEDCWLFCLFGGDLRFPPRVRALTECTNEEFDDFSLPRGLLTENIGICAHLKRTRTIYGICLTKRMKDVVLWE